MDIVFLNESNISSLDTNKKIFIFGAGAFAVDSMRFILRYDQKPFAFVECPLYCL